MWQKYKNIGENRENWIKVNIIKNIIIVYIINNHFTNFEKKVNVIKSEN